MTRHYLDHASTSLLRPAARDALTAALGLDADPGRIHEEALAARHAVEVARQQVADLLGARNQEVVFTSGATESIALACHGAARRDAEGQKTRSGPAAVEHSAVRHCADREGPVTVVGVDRAGVAAHSGSACASEGLEPSPVLEAMGVDAHRSQRLSVGWNTTDADVDAALGALPGILVGLRALR